MVRGATTFATRAEKPDAPVYRHFESTTITDQRRFEDEPEPTDDDQISKCTLKLNPRPS